MKISFVVPAYNEQALLPRSLTAIRDEIFRAGHGLGTGGGDYRRQ